MAIIDEQSRGGPSTPFGSRNSKLNCSDVFNFENKSLKPDQDDLTWGRLQSLHLLWDRWQGVYTAQDEGWVIKHTDKPAAVRALKARDKKTSGGNFARSSSNTSAKTS